MLLNLDEINSLYKQGSQESIKQAFNLFEKAGWPLKKILEYLWHNLSATVYDEYLIHYINEKSITIGPVLIKFYWWEDDEPLDVETWYVNYMAFTLLNTNGERIKSVHQEIHTDYLFKSVIYMEKENKFQEQKHAIETSFWESFSGINQLANTNLYSMLYNYFDDLINQIAVKNNTKPNQW